MKTTAREDNIVSSAEYVLGLMTPAEKAHFKTELEKNTELQQLCHEWTDAFTPLTNTVEEKQPRKAIKQQLMQRLFDAESLSETTADPSSLWDRLREQWLNNSWLNIKWIAASLSTLLLMTIIFLPGAPNFTPSYIAILENENRSLRVSATYDDRQDILRMETRLALPPVERDIELWLIVPNEAPISLGLLNVTNTYDINIPQKLAKKLVGSTLALSDEPVGGSPTGQPTGAVLALAQVTLI